MKYSLTRHAQKRMLQRGFQEHDTDLVIKFGKPIRRGLYLLRGKDVDREIQQRKHQIQTLERLRGSAVILAEDSVVTCYHVDGQAGQKALRGRGKRPKHPRK